MHKTSRSHGNTNNEASEKYDRDKDKVGCFDSRKITLAFKTDHCPICKPNVAQ